MVSPRVCALVGSPTMQWSNRSPSRGQPVQHFDRAVDGGAFLVAGDQKADRALFRRAVFGDPGEGGGGEGGDAALHVGGAAPNNFAIDNFAAERIDPPFLRVAGRHHIGMAGEQQKGRAVADAGVEIVDVRRAGFGKGQAMGVEPGGVQSRLKHVERAGVGGGNGRAADQGAGQRHAGARVFVHLVPRKVVSPASGQVRKIARKKPPPP